MNSIRFELDIPAFGMEVLKSPELQQTLEDAAAHIAQRCGDGYEYTSSIGRKRALAMVWAETYEAKVDNSENNTLLKEMR